MSFSKWLSTLFLNIFIYPLRILYNALDHIFSSFKSSHIPLNPSQISDLFSYYCYTHTHTHARTHMHTHMYTCTQCTHNTHTHTESTLSSFSIAQIYTCSGRLTEYLALNNLSEGLFLQKTDFPLSAACSSS